MKKSSFFIKLFFAHLFIIFILAVLIYFFSFKVIKNYYIKNLSVSLNNICLSLEPSIQRFFTDKNVKKIDPFVKQIGKKLKTRITIISTNGKVLGDSEKNPAEMENHKYRIEVQAALHGNMGKSLRFSKTIQQEMLYVAIPMKYNEKIIGIIRSSLFFKDISKLLHEMKIQILKIVFAITLIALFLSILFSKTVTNPLKKLVSAAKKIADGDFNTKIFLKNRGEFKRLADTFNAMTEKVSSLFSELTYEKNELKGILSSIKEGLFVINKEGRIINYNNRLQKITGIDNLKNKFYWEIFPKRKFLNLVKDSLIHRNNSIREIKLFNKIFLCSTANINSRNEIVFVLYDITEIKELENIKKDFIINVSHELKTPLTAIKGFSETLAEDENNSEKLHYLHIIQRHTNRMINIVNDLILLSKIESETDNYEFSKVNLIDIIKDAIVLFTDKASYKKIKIDLGTNSKKIIINGDKFKLEQLFINLIDNAIKYTDNGKIVINIKQTEKSVHIEISDTGIGIPEKDLNRIFERFYVVNKARTRESGGTGLGLSIVKHIVQLHKGKIIINSKINEGTMVKIIFYK